MGAQRAGLPCAANVPASPFPAPRAPLTRSSLIGRTRTPVSIREMSSAPEPGGASGALPAAAQSSAQRGERQPAVWCANGLRKCHFLALGAGRPKASLLAGPKGAKYFPRRGKLKQHHAPRPSSPHTSSFAQKPWSLQSCWDTLGGVAQEDPLR